MSSGFATWSNKPPTAHNVKAVRFGYHKPILESELNELQDLMFRQSLDENVPNTYWAEMGSKLSMEYLHSSPNITVSLVLDAVSTDDVIHIYFGGGLDYSFSPSIIGRDILYTAIIPETATNNTEISLIMRARLSTVSPDPTDADYDSSVDYAQDPRYPGMVTTKRIIVQSGFFDEESIDVSFDSLETVQNRINSQNIQGLNDEREVECVLGSWKYTSNPSNPRWRRMYEIHNGKDNPISPNGEIIGTYTLTVDKSAETGMLVIEPSIKSLDFAYIVDMTHVDRLIPINAIVTNLRLGFPNGIHNHSDFADKYLTSTYRLDIESQWYKDRFPVDYSPSFEDVLSQREVLSVDSGVLTYNLHFNYDRSVTTNIEVGTVTISTDTFI